MIKQNEGELIEIVDCRHSSRKLILFTSKLGSNLGSATRALHVFISIIGYANAVSRTITFDEHVSKLNDNVMLFCGISTSAV